jgi:hypothetical protein
MVMEEKRRPQSKIPSLSRFFNGSMSVLLGDCHADFICGIHSSFISNLALRTVVTRFTFIENSLTLVQTTQLFEFDDDLV